MEVILLSVAGLVVLLLALFGAFCCVRRIFFRKRPLSLRPAETEGQMARKDEPESAALIPGDAAPAARPDAADGENARPSSGLRQRPISAESLPPGSPLSRFAIVAAIALVISFGTSTAISHQIGSSLLSQVTSETYETVDLTGESEAAEEPTEDLGLAEIEVAVSAEDYAMVWAFGMVLCVASTALAAYPIMKMKPKSILSQMS